jgi:prepilin signal peptidase PulO-like enzyme (type II secretory pathway)
MIAMPASLAAPFTIVYLLVAAFVDLRYRKLPAWLTFGGAAGGILVAAASGLEGIELGLLGLVVGGVVLLPFAILGGVGWADVIFLGAVGAWNGWSFALLTALWTAFFGAVLAVVAWRRGSRTIPYVPAIALGALAASLGG